MERLTLAEKRQRAAERAAERKAAADRRVSAVLQARAQVATGKCPQCGAGLRRNLALTGWWQCGQYGDGHFRADPSKPACSWQTFTE